MAALVAHAGPVIGSFVFVAAAAASTTTGLLPTFTPDLGHVLAVAAYGLAALTSGFTRFFRREFVCRALGMGSPAALAGDLALLFRVHCGKASVVGTAASS